MNGILVINKDAGMTSRDVVNVACKKLNTKKIGHTGTLDPMAKGVLVLCVNKALKVVNEIICYDKEYVAEVTLGYNTDTLDSTGNILEKKSVKELTKEKLVDVLKSFVGEYEMEVPKYSAVKVNGKKLYEYARNNEEVILPIKKVTVYEIELIDDIKKENEIIKFNFRCKVSKGTYIRSLIRDICKKLGELGVMSDLVRTKQGDFCIEDAIKIDELDENTNLINIKDVLKLPMVEVDEFLYNKIKNGCKLENRYTYEKFCYIYNNEVVAIYIVDDDKSKVKPFKVL